MQREKTYAEIDAELKRKRFNDFVSDLVNNPELEINEAVLDVLLLRRCWVLHLCSIRMESFLLSPNFIPAGIFINT